MSAVENIRERTQQVVSNMQSRVRDIRGRASQQFPVFGSTNQSMFPMMANLKTRLRSRKLFYGLSAQIRPNIPAVPKEPPKMELELGMARPPVPVQPVTVNHKIYV